MKQILRTIAVCVGIVLLFNSPVSAQNEQVVVSEQTPPAALGTFQLIRTGKQQEAIQMDLLRMIETKRHETEVTYYMLSQNTLVKILPKSEINKPGFKPLTDLYMEEKSWEGVTK